METADLPLPRYDFYQTPEKLILSLYLKGYNAPNIKEAVEVDFQSQAVIVQLPSLQAESSSSPKNRLILGPLFANIKSEESTRRVLTSKLELTLVKAEPIKWPTLLASTDSGDNTSVPTLDRPSTASSSANPAGTTSIKAEKGGRKNWDRVVDDELGDGKPGDNGDPNAGGDAALQGLFSSIYSNADDNTKRAMIKSFTESGGTTLSTDWSSIGKEKTPIRPPDGMEARNYGK